MNFKMNETTNEEKIMNFLNGREQASLKEIAEHLQEPNRNNVGAYMYLLNKNKQVFRIAHGVYTVKKIVEKNNDDIQQLRIINNNLPDLEKIDTILSYKEKYGEEKFIEIIEKIKKIIK